MRKSQNTPFLYQKTRLKTGSGTGYHEFDRYLLQYPLGWCTGKETHYGSENRSMKVRFVQEDSGDEEMSGFI